MKESITRTELQIRVLTLEMFCYVLTVISVAGIITSIDILIDQVEILRYLGIDQEVGSDISYILEDWEELGLPDKAIAIPIVVLSLIPLAVQKVIDEIIEDTKRKLDN